jgi:hypothetical protein
MEAVMARTLTAVAVLTAAILFTAFAGAAAVYAVNEHCTDRMAWNGNC